MSRSQADASPTRVTRFLLHTAERAMIALLLEVTFTALERMELRQSVLIPSGRATTDLSSMFGLTWSMMQALTDIRPVQGLDRPVCQRTETRTRRRSREAMIRVAKAGPTSGVVHPASTSMLRSNTETVPTRDLMSSLVKKLHLACNPAGLILRRHKATSNKPSTF